uniref:Uncharacterized protein n=1 Tax=Amorphochlora amoebiformis TaxID=1561963 RepID=A0A6T6WIS4_9EUKA|mmetsp:Transcript_29435/g.46995  ORF Transcript_29435/g.46995 Transcript_29435/m.46995 type:complete len:174 (+) Transcript_29435:244-765(+)
MTWSGYVSLLKRNKTFRAFFSYALAKVPFKGYYWECNPVKSGLFDRLLEMAFVESSQLSDIKADSKRFDMHIQKLKGSNSVSVFPNLGRDAYLIVPAQSTKNAQTFAHLAAFVRNAPEDQKQALWEKTGKTFQTVLEQNKTVWVSTHGTGVYWLHVRIDTRPKYYSYTPFTKL